MLNRTGFAYTRALSRQFFPTWSRRARARWVLARMKAKTPESADFVELVARLARLLVSSARHAPEKKGPQGGPWRPWTALDGRGVFYLLRRNYRSLRY